MNTTVEDLLTAYLESNPMIAGAPDRRIPELEIRFGTNPKRPITKNHYDRVVQQLKSKGFTTDTPRGHHILRIALDNGGKGGNSRERAEINGLDLIQEYCSSNSLQKLIDKPTTTSSSIFFTSKLRPTKPGSGTPFPNVDLKEYDVRFSYEREQSAPPSSEMGKQILAKWGDTKKIFRYLNRVRFQHEIYPFYVDVTILKTSHRTGSGTMIPEFTVQDAAVFTNSETYEIEIEVRNDKMGPGSVYNRSKSLLDVLQKGMRIVLCGLQQSPFPIPYPEQENVLEEYSKLLGLDKPVFAGPKNVTLQKEHLVRSDIQSGTNGNVPTILTDYTVTVKADGTRALLFVSTKREGRIYLITYNLDVIFTGSFVASKNVWGTLLDGEWVPYSKTGNFIQLYLAFDLYYIKGESIRDRPFTTTSSGVGVGVGVDNQKSPDDPRLTMMNRLLSTSTGLIPQSVVATSSAACPLLRVVAKTFYKWSKSFQSACKDALNQPYEYATDGLVFTPAAMGLPPFQSTWIHCFKWKPPQYNTIDFLVQFQRDEKGNVKIDSHFQPGISTGRGAAAGAITQTQTLVLLCGFDKKKDIYANPFQDILDDVVPQWNGISGTSGDYVPARFVPTEPYDPGAGYCVLNRELENGRRVLKTVEGELIEDNTIVEFSYDVDQRKWIPLRVRYDKTSQLRANMKQYGNAYRVANANWKSIHSPITEGMLCGTELLPTVDTLDVDVDVDVDISKVYYNTSGNGGGGNTAKRLEAMRDFHNRFVKARLIKGATRYGQTLLDLAVGKAGDLFKWSQAKLSFVLGLDISRDNIHNNQDGACARFLKDRANADKNRVLRALFVQGDSSKNIRLGEAFKTDKDRQVVNAVLGVGPKDRKVLGEGVYRQYGVGKDGFDTTSCQFALHYFWETPDTLHNFLRNVTENTRLNGMFIATCYDGDKIFRQLQNKKKGESVIWKKEGETVLEITKGYSETGFPEDESCIGYRIEVFQESIGQTIPEYLVHGAYLTRLMEDYGFVLLSNEECVKGGFPSSQGSFQSLFETMMDDPTQLRRYGQAPNMTNEEKQISFLNSYFIYKKIRQVNNPEKIKTTVIHREERGLDEDREERGREEDVLTPPPVMVKKKRKITIHRPATATATPPKKE